MTEPSQVTSTRAPGMGDQSSRSISSWVYPSIVRSSTLKRSRVYTAPAPPSVPASTEAGSSPSPTVTSRKVSVTRPGSVVSPPVRVSSAGVPPESAPAPAETSPPAQAASRQIQKYRLKNRHHFFMKHRLLCLYSRQRRRFGSTSGAIFIPLGEHETPAPSAPLCPVPAAGEAGIPVPQTADG